jgi:porin
MQNSNSGTKNGKQPLAKTNSFFYFRSMKNIGRMKCFAFIGNRCRGLHPVRLVGGLVLASLWVGSVFASPPPRMTATGNDKGVHGCGLLEGIKRRSYGLGDLCGLREWLNKYGGSLTLTETSEALGNATGGVNQGVEYDGLTQAIFQLDTQRAFHWYGGTFNVSGLQIHGQNLSEDNLYTLQTASGIESDRATRLWELWYDQKFDHEGKYDIKIGQQSLDQEFMSSQNALLFVNTMFGWAMLPSADMPGGGPAYPLSALGVRAHVRPGNSWTLLAGAFTGNANQQNVSGTAFPLDGALGIAELQYAYPSLGSTVHGGNKTPLSRTYKLGAWYDNVKFDDQRFDSTGLSLANPASTGVAQTHHGDYALYAVADQMLWVDPNENDRTVSVFVRPMGTPLADRNAIDFSMNAGLTFAEPIMHRDDDTLGVGMGFAHVSNRAADLDRDQRTYSNSTGLPIRSGETYVEATYQYQVTPWWQVQPDFQYVFNPGAGIVNPKSSSGQKVKDEAVFGIRMNFAF